MKHVFILNPAAGSGRSLKILPDIIAATSKAEVDYEVHRTVSIGGARNFVKSRLEQAGEEQIRFYACGGDGTLNEVVNSTIGHDNAELAVVPVGTGNDFVRNFENPKDFLDFDKQLNGTVRRIDALGYEYVLYESSDTDAASDVNTNSPIRQKGYALNMFNLGYDAEVVAKTAELKSGLLKGTSAYVAGVLSCLVKLNMMDIDIEIDGEKAFEGEYLMAGAANGGFSGGGFHGLPVAKVDDGIMDMLLVKKISRRFFLSIVKQYHDGKHLGNEKLEGLLFHRTCKEVLFRSGKPLTIAIDGETTFANELKVKIIPDSVNFVIPG